MAVDLYEGSGHSLEQGPRRLHLARTNRLRQRGGMLLEVILAAAVSAMVGVMYLENSVRSTRGIEARNIAEYTASFQAAALSYAGEKGDSILAAATDGTNASTYCVVNYVNAGSFGTFNDTTKHTCGVDVSGLVQQGFLPATFAKTNKLGQAPLAVFRRVYVGATPTGNMEMVVLATSKIDTVSYANARSFTKDQDAFTAANTMGTNMGVVPSGTATAGCVWNAGAPGSSNACGTQGAWKITLSDFINYTP